MLLFFESRNLSEMLSFGISVLIAIFLYCVFVFLFGLMDREDLKMIPFFGRMIKDK